jgi:hypothetical protein
MATVMITTNVAKRNTKFNPVRRSPTAISESYSTFTETLISVSPITSRPIPTDSSCSSPGYPIH